MILAMSSNQRPLLWIRIDPENLQRKEAWDADSCISVINLLRKKNFWCYVNNIIHTTWETNTTFIDTVIISYF